MTTRILFTGAQGTGKTSVMNVLPCGIQQVRNITRTVAKNNNLSINTESSDESQAAIFNAYLKALSRDVFFVSERSLLDVFAYTLYQSSIGKCSGRLARSQERELKTFVQKHKNDVYVYFPIEFDPVADGVRSVDKEYQKAIDWYIQDNLKALKINYIQVTGTVEERKKQVEELIKKYNK